MTSLEKLLEIFCSMSFVALLMFIGKTQASWRPLQKQAPLSLDTGMHMPRKEGSF